MKITVPVRVVLSEEAGEFTASLFIGDTQQIGVAHPESPQRAMETLFDRVVNNPFVALAFLRILFSNIEKARQETAWTK